MGTRETSHRSRAAPIFTPLTFGREVLPASTLNGKLTHLSRRCSPVGPCRSRSLGRSGGAWRGISKLWWKLRYWLVSERLYVIHPAAGSGRTLLRLGQAQIGELGQCLDGSGARASNIGYAPQQGETAPAKILAGHPQKIFGRELFSGAGGAPVPQKIGSQPALGSGRCCWRLLARPESRGSLAVIGACPTRVLASQGLLLGALVRPASWWRL